MTDVDNKYPLVSVLMTCYNRENFITEAIESVLASAYSNFELIIVDDGSKDKTVEIANAYANKDERIKVFVNEKNLGDYPNRNKAASYAKGEYLKYVDSDDMLNIDGIEKCLEAMSMFPDAGFGLEYKYKDKSDPISLNSKEGIYTHFFKRPLLGIGPGGAFIKRKIFEEIGGFPTKYGPANDMYFNLKIASKTAIVLLPFDIIFYRIHEGQEVNNKVSYLYNNYRYLNDALVEIDMFFDKRQLKYLNLKNKRRFILNVLKDFSHTLKTNQTLLIIRNAQFTFTDFIKGAFHLIKKKSVLKN